MQTTEAEYILWRLSLWSRLLSFYTCPLDNEICGASSEFVSSSIPSWQILTAHAQSFRGARDLAFCLKVPLDSLLLWGSSGGSGETARMRRLAWTLAARIGDKYQIRLTRPIFSWFFLRNSQICICMVLHHKIALHAENSILISKVFITNFINGFRNSKSVITFLHFKYFFTAEHKHAEDGLTHRIEWAVMSRVSHNKVLASFIQVVVYPLYHQIHTCLHCTTIKTQQRMCTTLTHPPL